MGDPNALLRVEDSVPGTVDDAIPFVLVMFPTGYRLPMTDPPHKLTPVDPCDLAARPHRTRRTSGA